MITGVFYPNKDFTCLFIREKKWILRTRTKYSSLTQSLPIAVWKKKLKDYVFYQLLIIYFSGNNRWKCSSFDCIHKEFLL